MKKQDYIIVGAEVDSARRYLQPGGEITKNQGADGTPLTVEFIGKLFVDISENPPNQEKMAEYQDQVKAALRAVAGPGQQSLSIDEEDEILDNTEVEIVVEQRYQTGNDPEKNKRILVVPVRGTLGPKKIFVDTSKKEGDFPEFTYELDRLLMLKAYRQTIIQIVEGFASEGHKDWTQSLQNALEKYTEDKLDDAIAAPPSPDDVLAQILKTPVRAFYRSVGIYTTTMCL